MNGVGGLGSVDALRRRRGRRMPLCPLGLRERRLDLTALSSVIGAGAEAGDQIASV